MEHHHTSFSDPTQTATKNPFSQTDGNDGAPTILFSNIINAGMFESM